ncbi:copper resistance protein B [Xanthomonas euvesicatoria pv. allii]|uniref:copper resistance protein B n=1 Tax=Xanthomonas euvesicatoria TaxID=456327 RepID=UPI0024068779|nr:copper resistance protein B [Xanthomonas euvesicatoria]MCP3050700.1 copper resistance protein B [Xanthomonas euvesicatoria pv. allii]
MSILTPTTIALALAGSLVLDAPAFAQTMDHSTMTMPMPGMSQPEAPTESENAPVKEQAPAHQHAPPSKTSPPAPAKAASAPAAQDMSSMQGMDHSGMQHDMSSMEGMDQDMPSMPGMDHGAMDHSTMDHGASATSLPRTPIPAVTDADRTDAVPPDGNHVTTDNVIQSYFLVNRLEAWNADPGTGQAWEAQGWIGTDLDRMWLRSEGEREDGRTEAADLEVLYGRSVATWWDVVGGIRHDFTPGGAQTFAAIGVQGLAPQKFEVEATAYLGEGGQTAARFEAEYELLLTNRLILQPLVEVEAYGKNDPARGIGAGLSTAGAGLRLRYEITRRFAPYVGVVYERAFGDTADFRRDEGKDSNDTRFVAGVRLWF